MARSGTVAKDVVSTLTGPAAAAPASDDDAAVAERDLLVDAMRLVLPPRGLQPRNDVPTTGVSFVGHAYVVRESKRHRIVLTVRLGDLPSCPCEGNDTKHHNPRVSGRQNDFRAGHLEAVLFSTKRHYWTSS